jgi:outer membrane protein OmpA-like peptidoglycan-associated protein
MQAMIAVDLAERAGAERFAAEELHSARQSRQKTINAAEAGLDIRQLAPLAHETVRLAVEAEKLAKERTYRFDLDERRRAQADEIANLERKIKESLGASAEMRDTARGLIVNLPDILFEFDQATLKPRARETLGRLCGILLVTDGYELSIEGHTDNIGADEYNQWLSERRAESVMNYLMNCGGSYNIVNIEGYGESQPIASNETAEGRRTNRRVEIVIQKNGEVAESGR